MNSVVSVASLASAAALASPSIAVAEATEPFANLQKVDPIFALIDRHRTMVAEINNNDHYSKKELDAACEAERAVEDQIREAPFTTINGAAAALRYIAKYEIEGKCDNKEIMHFILRVSDAIERMGYAVDPSATVVVAANPEVEDPICALLKEHDLAWCKYKEARHKFLAADRKQFESEKGFRAFDRANAAMYSCYRKHERLVQKIVKTQPTTRLGMSYKLQHLDRMARLDDMESPCVFDKKSFQALVKSTILARVTW